MKEKEMAREDLERADFCNLDVIFNGVSGVFLLPHF